MANEASVLSKRKIREIFPAIGQRYELIGKKPIGTPRGLGAVWQAHDQWLDRDVALKVSDNNLREEISLCRDIEGQTARIFDYFRGEGDWNAYAMELLHTPWLSLSKFIKQHKYRPNDLQHYFDSFEIARSILNGLVQIHARPDSREGRFVHADIKPDNLFVLVRPKKHPNTVFRMPGQGELVKIMDMGVSGENENSLNGFSPAYGNDKTVFARQGRDLYSLAIIFLELLTGTRPNHEILDSKYRIGSFLVNSQSSGSIYLDILASDFAVGLARAASQAGTRPHKLLNQFDESLFDIGPTFLLSLRAINKGLDAECNKGHLAEFLFDTYARYYGWANRTTERHKFLKSIVKTMFCQGMLARIGRKYSIR